MGAMQQTAHGSDMDKFGGAKVALFFQGSLIVYLRDDKPGLNFANMWDFPGGGREGTETPVGCITREIEEEFGLRMKPEAFVWQKQFPSMTNPELVSYFFVARITQEEFAAIRFGSEGKRWQMMSVSDFLAHEQAVPNLKTRLQDYLDSNAVA